MKKRLLSLFGKASRTKTQFECFTHSKQKIKANEYCLSCELQFCYLCGNQHFDSLCQVEWGKDLVENNFKLSSNTKVIRFNSGYPFKINLIKLKCPCGNDFLTNETSAICSACGTATCSAECHKKYMEDTNECLFNHNFMEDYKTVNFHGLRLIQVKSILYAIENEFPPYTRNSESNSKFIKSLKGEEPFSIILLRGFRQYGQPHEETYKHMEEITNDKGKELYELNSSRLCLCTCSECSNRSPHPVYNCYRDCQVKEDLTEEDKLNLKLYQVCKCHCNFCTTISEHRKENCMYSCQKYTYNRH